jgi:hypothetical protein
MLFRLLLTELRYYYIVIISIIEQNALCLVILGDVLSALN